MEQRNFFAELKRRNVYKVAVAYAVIAWLLIQAASILFPTFEAPAWVMKVFVVVVVAGFPIALVIAWAFELTPEGIKRAEDVAPNDSITRKTGRKLVGVTIALAAVAAGLFVFQSLRSKNTPAPRQDANAARTEAAPSSIPAKSIAVLPFESLSEDKANAYFADGIQDQILTKLASVADLKVISRTSTAKYKSRPEDLKTVARELGVATVLEGTVQRAGEKVRVNVQLIDARADSHLWAKSYDRDLNDVFAIQSEVAQEIADALRAKLSPAEANTLAIAPTKDTAAYDFFLKGEHEHRAALAAQTPEPFDQAVAWYRQAIARDPEFALAMAQLVVCRMRRHWLAESLDESELIEVGRMAKHALTLAPDLAEAHVALGVFHYYGSRQYDLALAEFQRAIELQPNNSEALAFSGYVHRRQGKWNSALEELAKSLKQDPRNATIEANVAQTYLMLRRWKEAERTAQHALIINPHDATSLRVLLLSYLNRGDEREALRTLAGFPSDVFRPNSGSLGMFIGYGAETRIFCRDFNAALKEWETGFRATSNERQRLSAKTAIRVLAGDLSGAQADADKARLLLEARLGEHPDEIRSMRALSWVYLALNRNEDANRIARQTLDLLPPEKDAVLGASNLASLAEIQARTGATG